MHEVKNTYKVLIVGDYKAGKTALLNRYVNDWFHQSYKPTVGFDILKKEILLNNKNQIILSLWDSGGLITQITSKKDKFFRHADASVVVFSLNDKKSLSAIKTHINSIRENVNNEIPIIVFGTKADLIDEEQSYFEMKESLQSLTQNLKVDLFIGSSKTGKNINLAFEHLVKRIIDLKEGKNFVRSRRRYDSLNLSLEEIRALSDLEKLILKSSDDSFLFVPKLQNDLIALERDGFPIEIELHDTNFGIKVRKGHVVEIGLFNSGLKSLPPTFESFCFLKKLILRCNSLKIIPEAIFKIASLEILDLSLTNLTEIPDKLKNLKNLKEIYLENNHLTTLPDTIDQLSHLKVLNIENNPINKLPGSVCLLSSLERFYLEAAPFQQWGYLIKLPDCFGNLYSLQELDLSSHKIRALPHSFNRLTHLRFLDLYNNEFRALPSYIGGLSLLETLNLESNKIEYIPDSIGNLKYLKKVDLKDNLFLDNGTSIFRALAFKSTGADYDRLMKIANECEKEVQAIKEDKKEKSIKRKIVKIGAPILYAGLIAFIGLLTFLSVDFSSELNLMLIWLLFGSAFFINFLIGSSIISTISNYFKFSVETLTKEFRDFRTRAYKIFDIFVVLLLIWAIRSAIKKGLSIELIPPVNFLFQFTIPDWILEILVFFGYNFDLTFLENLDLFFGHFYLKLFSTALVFWALFRNGFSNIKRTAFEKKQKKNIWAFLALGLFGAFGLAIMNYSSLKPHLSIGYSIGVIIGACIFIREKNKENKIIFYDYMIVICAGIACVWFISLWNILVSLFICIVFIILFFVIRRKSHKWNALRNF